MWLVVFIVESVVVVVMVDNRLEMMKDVMGVVVFVEYWSLMLWVDSLAIDLPNTEYGFVILISLWRLRLRSGPRKSISGFPLLNEIMSFFKRLSRISLSIWLSLTCEILR